MEPEGVERTVGTDITVDWLHTRGLLVVEESSGFLMMNLMSTGHSSVLWFVDLSRNIGLELFQKGFQGFSMMARPSGLQ